MKQKKQKRIDDLYHWHSIFYTGRFVCGYCGNYFSGQIYVQGSQYGHVRIMCQPCKENNCLQNQKLSN